MPASGKQLLHLKPTYELIVIRMLFSLGIAAAIVGTSLYLVELGLTDSQVGFFRGGASLVVGVFFLFLPPFLEKFNQLRLIISSSLLVGLFLALFGITKYLVIAMIIIIAIDLAAGVFSNAKSILFKDSARNKKEFIKDTGFAGSFANLGWFLGPLLGGLMLNYAGFRGLFALSGFLVALGGVYVFLFPFKTTVKKRAKLDSDLRANVKFYTSRKMLKIAYFQRMGTPIWWAFIWTFMPIFMLNDGYSLASIGLYIGATQLPLFLFEFKTVYAVARFGYRKVLSWSYGSLVAVCIAAFFAPNLGIALAFLFVGSLAMSFIEPISELFFFDQVSLLEEEKTYPIFGTSDAAGKILSRISIGFVLAVFADKWSFVLIGLFMLFIAHQAIGIKQSK